MKTGRRKNLDFLWIDAEMDNLTSISRFIKDRLSSHEAYRDRTDQQYLVELAVVEACTNVIRHAYRPSSAKKLCVRLKRSGNTVHILILDKGIPFDPTTTPAPNLNEPREGGYGVYLIRQIMKNVFYERRGSQWNYLHLTHEITDQGQNMSRVCERGSEIPG